MHTRHRTRFETGVAVVNAEHPHAQPLSRKRLLRSEAGATQAEQCMCSVRWHHPLPVSLVTGSALAIALALIAIAARAEVNRKARLSGLLVPALAHSTSVPPQPGTVMQLPVSEGQTVQAGDVLLKAERSPAARGLQAARTYNKFAPCFTKALCPRCCELLTVLLVAQVVRTPA